MMKWLSVMIWTRSIKIKYAIVLVTLLTALWSWSWASNHIRKIAGCACAGNAGNFFPATRNFFPGLAIPICITARAWRTCRDAFRDRLIAISFEDSGGENVPGIPGACPNRNFAYLVRGPWLWRWWTITITTLKMGWNISRDFRFPVPRYTWMEVPQHEKTRIKNRDYIPFRAATLVGCALAVQKEHFFRIGAFDDAMNIWGGENIELAFRNWMCGGQVLTHPCSRVAHVFKPFSYR